MTPTPVVGAGSGSGGDLNEPGRSSSRRSAFRAGAGSAGPTGSARRAGSEAGVEDFVEAFAAEAGERYGAVRVPLDAETLARAREGGPAHVARAAGGAKG